MHKILVEYFRNKQEVIAVYLFGSYAHGKERRFSDVDIAILFDFDGADKESFMERRTWYMVELGRALRKDIHAVILNLAGEELLRQVFVKGHCIVVNDSDKLTRYKMIAYSRIEEFTYYLNQMQGGFIRKVAKG